MMMTTHSPMITLKTSREMRIIWIMTRVAKEGMKLAMRIGVRRLEFVIIMENHFGHLVTLMMMNVMVEVVKKELEICRTTGSPPMIVEGASFHGSIDWVLTIG